MSKFKFFTFLLLLAITISQAQVTVTFGKPPEWAPENRVETQYYYIPEVDAYYDVPQSRFIYVQNGKWVRNKTLPYKYRNYNLKGGNIIYLTDYRGTSPYKFHKNHLIKYPKKGNSKKVYVVKKTKNIKKNKEVKKHKGKENNKKN